jgi:aspartate racemase
MRRQNITPRIDMGRHSAPLVQQIQEVQVKKIGILGGMSAASTQIYYQTLCSLTQSELGCLHSPNLLIRSVDFAPLALHMNDGNWSAICDTLHAEAKLLAVGGAELIVLATSTMHKLKDQIMQSIDLPFIHIAEATATAVLTGGSKRPAFFATKFTMQEAFYLDILRDNGLGPIVLNTTEQDVINDIIFDELCKNIATAESEATYLDILKRLKAQGADSVILGCTEVCLLLNAQNTAGPVYDTTQIHCQAAIRTALD